MRELQAIPGPEGYVAADTSELGKLAGFLERVVTGRVDLTARVHVEAKEPDAHRIATAVNELLDRVQRDLGELAFSVTAASTAGRTQEALSSVADDVAEHAERFGAVRLAVAQTAQGASDVSSLTRTGSASADELRAVADHSIAAASSALEQLADVRERCEMLRDGIVALDRSVGQIGELAKAVNAIAEQTNVLALNAAIEAARAGQAGAAFAVVAREIRRLADTAASETRRITGAVHEVRDASAAALAGAHETAAAVTVAAAESGSIREDLERTIALVADLGIGISSIAAVAEEQSAALGQIVLSVTEVEATANASAQRAAQLRELGSADLNLVTGEVFARYVVGDLTDRVYDIACEAAVAIEVVLDRAASALPSRGLSIYSTDYREMRGSEITRLRTLCDVSRASAAGFDPPKYFTGWDSFLDAELAPIVDTFGHADEAIQFCCVVDVNGFATMHRRDRRQAITGDPTADLAGNRVKRIFDSPVALRAARVGLDAELVPKRATRAQFAAAGVDLDRMKPTTERSRIVQSYARDTGEVLTDLAVPLFAGGRRWGALRLSFRPTGA